MSEQDDTQTNALQRPTNKDKEVWRKYWIAQGHPWRSEPEIDMEQQKNLAVQRSITPDIEQGIYAFKDAKLSRADVEWLLATHENGLGPVNWIDGGLQERKGLDLRGADLQGANLSRLPLTGMQGALNWNEWLTATNAKREAALINLEGAELSFTHLERAILREAHLEKANLYGVHLEGAYLYGAHLEGAILKGAFFDSSTHLGKISFASKKFGVVSLADVRWNDVNLTDVNWGALKELGEEQKAHWQKKHDGTTGNKERQLNEYRRAVRANRQLAYELQGQGLNEEAAYFAYRAQGTQRMVYWLQRRILKFIFSRFLDLLAGYGYRPLRSFFWYMVLIVGFAISYSVFGHLQMLPDAFVFSLTSFHGRGFFPGLEIKASLHNPLVVLAAFEAVFGLFIEISFIATFTQRFFGK